MGIRGVGPLGCPQVTVPISVPLQRAQAVLQGSKRAHKHAVQLATRVNKTQQELARQERVAEELRGGLEEAEQVSRVPWDWLCAPGSSQSQEAGCLQHRASGATKRGECLGTVSGIWPRVISAPDLSVCVARWGQR